MVRCLIALGANLGDPEQTLNEALNRLARESGIDVTARSRWRVTAPAGGPAGQPPFLNGAAVLDTSLAPRALWAALARIENDLGRRRAERWGPRLVDLDLLLYDQLVLRTPKLILPHPRMAWRRFVLEPAAEIAGDWLHPTTGWTLQRLREHLDHSANYLALAGPPNELRRRLAQEIARQTGAQLVSLADLPRSVGQAAADSPGTAWETAVKFLEQAAHRLRPEDWAGHQRGALVVSDSWYEELLLEAGRRVPAKFSADWSARAQELRSAASRPRLVAILEEPSTGGRTTAADRLKEQAAAIDQGPTLSVPADDFAAALAEVQGAVTAMQ